MKQNNDTILVELPKEFPIARLADIAKEYGYSYRYLEMTGSTHGHRCAWTIVNTGSDEQIEQDRGDDALIESLEMFLSLLKTPETGLAAWHMLTEEAAIRVEQEIKKSRHGDTQPIMDAIDKLITTLAPDKSTQAKDYDHVCSCPRATMADGD